MAKQRATHKWRRTHSFDARTGVHRLSCLLLISVMIGTLRDVSPTRNADSMGGGVVGSG